MNNFLKHFYFILYFHTLYLVSQSRLRNRTTIISCPVLLVQASNTCVTSLYNGDDEDDNVTLIVLADGDRHGECYITPIVDIIMSKQDFGSPYQEFLCQSPHSLRRFYRD